MSAQRVAQRSTFARTVLTGLLTSGIAAIAGTRSWVKLSDSAEQHAATQVGVPVGEVPLAGALALVVLACWGVLLVTRGRVRRSLALIAAVVSLAVAVTSVVGSLDVVDSAVKTLGDRGFQNPEASRNLWGPVCGVAGVLAALVALLAFRWAPGWPEMGRRYDAPSGASSTVRLPGTEPADAEEGAVTDTANLELWKSLDQGFDPTADDPSNGPEKPDH